MSLWLVRGIGPILGLVKGNLAEKMLLVIVVVSLLLVAIC